MASYAADDYKAIRNELRRNQVIEMGIQAGLTEQSEIPIEIFLAAGFSKEEIELLPQRTRQWPLLESELR